MKTNWKILVYAAITALLVPALAGCGSDSSSSGTSTPAVTTAEYVGSEVCESCHAGYYSDFIDSGHPYKLNKVVDAQVPAYPFSDITGALEMVDDEDGVTDNSLGTPLSYADVTYVIGGYGWKARWIDADGYIVTGSAVQYNLEDGSMAGYHDDEVDKKYTCGNCHTTGWRPFDETLNPNRQDNLPGMAGTFAETGIGCESCHGAGGDHVEAPFDVDMTKVAIARTTAQLSADDQGYGLAVTCGECHTRDGEKNSRKATPYVSDFEAAAGLTDTLGGRIVSNGTIGKHHQQYDELLGVDPDTNEIVGKKIAAGMTCITCHDPHKTTKYGAEGAIRKDCLECHGTGGANEVVMPVDSAMADLDCTTCHMPKLAKSAIWTGTNKAGKKEGDIKSHVFKIDLTKTEQITADGKFVYPWITADYACGSCHAVAGFGFDVAQYKFHQATKWEEPAQAAEFAGADYVGSATCKGCHNTSSWGFIGDDFTDSGHPYKLNKVVNDSVPTYPFSDITGALELVTDDDLAAGDPKAGTDNTLGTPASYADVTYVIGGYGWKARWIDADGYIVTGSAVQYNLEDGSMAGYHDNEVDKPYNCGNCHTTGWKHFDAVNNPNRQDNLPGMDGTFVETGIGCESCHGGGSEHAGNPSKDNIVRVAGGRTTADFLEADMAYGQAVACGECHTRDGEKDYPSYESGANTAGYTGNQGGRIVSNGTIAKHHEQYDELLGLDINADGSLGEDGPLGRHLKFGVGCISCHDPHKTTKYGAEGAVKDCAECHVSVGFNVELHANFDCVDCHMPELAKSAIWTGTNAAGKKLGDIKTHIFKIDLSKSAQLTDDSAFVNPWITPDYACGKCHADTATKVGNLINYGGTMHK